MGTLSDFKVAEGLIVGGSDIHLNGSVNATISVDTVVGTDADGKSLTISAGAGNGTGVGGILDFKTAPGGTSGSGAGTPASRMSIAADGTVTIGNLDVSAGTLTLANDQISGDKISGGTIGTTTITALAGDLSLGDNSITNVGDINADSLSVDAAGNGLKLDFSGADTAKSIILMGDNLASALDITEGSNSYVKFTTTNSSEQIVFGKNSTFSGTTIADLGTVTTANIDGGSIDGTTIGANSAAAGTFAALQGTSILATTHGRIGGTARETNTLLQVNGVAVSAGGNLGGGGSAASADTNKYSEVRIYSDIANDDLAGMHVEHMGGVFIVDNAEEAPNTGQGTIYTVGRSDAANADSWGIGRQATTGKFAIGYISKDYDNVADSSENPMRTGQAYMEIDTSGNAVLNKAEATLGFTSNSQVTKIRGHASASDSITYQLPADHPSSSGYVLSSTTGGVMSWVAQSSGTITALNNATENELVTVGSTTTELDAEANLTFSGTTLSIKNLSNDTAGAELKFVKDKGAAGADGDDVGKITFTGDDAAQTQTDFGQILVEVSEADNTDEAGKMSFLVAESDGTTTALTAGLILEGEHATDGQVDVTIGAGAGSTTTIVGDLIVSGSTTTINTAQLTVEDDLITVSKGNDTVANAGGSGIEIDVTGGTNIGWKYVHGVTGWQSNVDIDLGSTSESYKIAGTDVLTNTQVLGKPVGTNSSNSIVTLDDIQTLAAKTLETPKISTSGGSWAAQMDTKETDFTGSSLTTVFSYNGATVRTAKLLIQVTNDSDPVEVHAVEMLVTYEGNNGPASNSDANVFAVEYASVFTGAAAMGTFDVADSSGSDNIVDVNFTPAASDTYKVKVFATLLQEE